MPRQIATTVYKYNELSDKAKEKARDWYREGALDYEWWDSIYDEASNWGIKIEGFELDRVWKLHFKLTQSEEEVAQAIMKDLPVEHDLYIASDGFLNDIKEDLKVIQGYEADNGSYSYANYSLACQNMQEYCRDYRGDIEHQLLTILQKEADYITSNEAVEESIRANEYEFYEDGSWF